MCVDVCVCGVVCVCMFYKLVITISVFPEFSNILSFHTLEYDFVKNCFSSKSNNNIITTTTRIVDVVGSSSSNILHAFWLDFCNK